jgi:hypothetical protein
MLRNEPPAVVAAIKDIIEKARPAKNDARNTVDSKLAERYKGWAPVKPKTELKEAADDGGAKSFVSNQHKASPQSAKDFENKQKAEKIKAGNTAFAKKLFPKHMKEGWGAYAQKRKAEEDDKHFESDFAKVVRKFAPDHKLPADAHEPYKAKKHGNLSAWGGAEHYVKANKLVASKRPMKVVLQADGSTKPK